MTAPVSGRLRRLLLCMVKLAWEMLACLRLLHVAVAAYSTTSWYYIYNFTCEMRLRPCVGESSDGWWHGILKSVC